MIGRIAFRAIAFRAIALATVLNGAIEPLDARGQSDLIPLQQYLDLPADQRTPAYPLIRCAGLHSGLLAYGVAAALPPDIAREAERVATLFMRAAVFVRVRLEGHTVEAVSQNVTRSVKLVSDLYAQRARNNYARTGEAFGSDPLILGDLESCRQIGSDIAQKFPELMQLSDP